MRHTEVLDCFLAAFPSAPTFVLLADRDRSELVNAAFRRQSRVLADPFGEAEVRSLVLDVLAARWALPRAMLQRFLSFSRQHHLTTPQAELLAKYINNVPRRRIAEELGISDNTLKTRVRQLLAKAGAGTLELAYDAMVRG